jgi:hypothetical protein
MDIDPIVAAQARKLLAANGISGEPFVEQRNEQVRWLREIADAIEALPENIDVRTAFAFFLEQDIEVHGKIGRRANVRCGGFNDDEQAARYFLSALRNLGFKS